MSFKIKYGIASNNIDVTQIVFDKCIYNNCLLFIPRGDTNRDRLFTDPIEGTKKYIFIKNHNSIAEYSDTQEIYIQMEYKIYDQTNLPEQIKLQYSNKYKYTAIIIEPRQHRALHFVLNNFLENLSSNWSIILFHGNKNIDYVNNIIDNQLTQYKQRISLVNLNVDNLTDYEYSDILKNKDIYDYIKTEHFLIFQTDTLILKENKHLINGFLQYDYVGAPWKMDKNVGNGGLSLRRKSKMLEIIDQNSKQNTIEIHGKIFNTSEIHEDIFFSYCKDVYVYKPDFETAQHFSVETVFNDKSFGIHKPWHFIELDEWEYLKNKYSDLHTLKELQ